jgi:hypothetical protein
MKMKQVLVASGAAALFALAGLANAEGPATDESLMAEVTTLKARLNELEGRQSQQWLDTRRTEEVKQLVREVLADADTRASLQGDAAVAGYGGDRFFLASADGNFRLNIGGQIQVRYIFNHRNDAGDNGAGGRTNADDNEGGFQIRRTKLFLDGYIGSPKITYRLQLAADRNNNSLGVEVVSIGYKVTDSLTISGGRFKDQFLRESLIADQKQMAVERSTVENIFGNNYVEGIQAVWTPVECAKITAAFTDGAGSGNIAGTTGPSSLTAGSAGNDFQNDNTHYAATVRGDVKVLGDWKQSEDFAAWSGGTALFVGAAATYQEGETGDMQSSTVYDDTFKYTVDALFKSSGLSLYGAFVGQESRVNDQGGTNGAGANAGHTRENMGAMLQAGYFVIPDKLEPYVRYEWLNIDSDAGSPGAVNLFTFGANYYIKKHAAKFTLDVEWAPEGLTAASTFAGNSASTGQLNDSPVNEDQVVVRAQFQLLF